jgi:hypothetical protein
MLRTLTTVRKENITKGTNVATYPSRSFQIQRDRFQPHDEPAIMRKQEDVEQDKRDMLL